MQHGASEQSSCLYLDLSIESDVTNSLIVNCTASSETWNCGYAEVVVVDDVVDNTSVAVVECGGDTSSLVHFCVFEI